MRYFLLTLLVFALVVPAFAKEIVLLPDEVGNASGASSMLGDLAPVFGGKGETIIGPFGNESMGYHYSSSTSDLGCDYIAPADCYIMEIGYIFGSSGTVGNPFVAAIWSSDGGSSPLPDTELGNIACNVTVLSAWDDFEITSMGLTLDNGDDFFAGLENNGTATWLSFDNTSGTYHHYVYRSTTSWTWSSMNRNMNVRVIVNDDFDGPYASGQDPADGATSVPVDSNIVFHIEDDDVGVDSGSINGDSVVVTDDTKAAISGTLDVNDADPNDVIVTFDPDSDFTEGSEVTVTVSPSGNEITDDLGNTMAEDSWSFSVFLTGVESVSMGEIKANFTEEGTESIAPGAETAK